MLYARQWCWHAEDALQEAIIEFARQPSIPADPVAWMFQAVRFRALNYQRSEKRRARYHARAASEQAEWFEDDSEHVERDALQVALQSLTELDREIVIARIWGGLRLEQIATLTGRSTSTIHRRYQSALVALRSTLSDTESRQESMCDE